MKKFFSNKLIIVAILLVVISYFVTRTCLFLFCNNYYSAYDYAHIGITLSCIILAIILAIISVFDKSHIRFISFCLSMFFTTAFITSCIYRGLGDGLFHIANTNCVIETDHEFGNAAIIYNKYGKKIKEWKYVKLDVEEEYWPQIYDYEVVYGKYLRAQCIVLIIDNGNLINLEIYDANNYKLIDHCAVEKTQQNNNNSMLLTTYINKYIGEMNYKPEKDYLYVNIIDKPKSYDDFNNVHKKVSERQNSIPPKLTTERVKTLCEYIPDHGLKEGSEKYITEDFYDLLVKSFEISRETLKNVDLELYLQTDWLYYFVTGNDPGTPCYTVLNISYDEENNATAEIRIKELWENGEYSKHDTIKNLALSYENGSWKISDFDNNKINCIELIDKYEYYKTNGDLLLYEGEYTFNDYYELESFPGNTFPSYVYYGPAHVKIHAKSLSIEFENGPGFKASYKETNRNGTRIYEDYYNTFYVSPSFNLYYRVFIDSPYAPGYAVYRSQKGPATMHRNNSYTNYQEGYSTTNTNYNQPSQTIDQSSHKHWRTITREADCPICHHSGRCNTCNGKGWYNNPYTGKPVDCPNCTNGQCSHCGGRGTITKTESKYE